MEQVLLITPLREEFELVTRSLHQYGYAFEEGYIGREKVLKFPELSATVAVGGHGKAQCAVQTQYLVDHHRGLDLVVCAGAGGSLAHHLAIGDVVVGTYTIEHDYNLRFALRPMPTFEGYKPALESIRQATSNLELPFSVRFGAVASGDEDIVMPERAQALAEQTQAICVAWEGAGVARASVFNNLAFIELRSVTDTADKLAPHDFNQNLELAMHNLSSLIRIWLSGNRSGTGINHVP